MRLWKKISPGFLWVGGVAIPHRSIIEWGLVRNYQHLKLFFFGEWEISEELYYLPPHFQQARRIKTAMTCALQLAALPTKNFGQGGSEARMLCQSKVMSASEVVVTPASHIVPKRQARLHYWSQRELTRGQCCWLEQKECY
jgi:hypothetical protein